MSGAAAAADWWAVAHHENGASYLQAGLATVGLGLGGVSFVAGKAVDADSAWCRPRQADALRTR